MAYRLHIYILTALLTLVSCAGRDLVYDDDVQETATGTVQIRFTINMGGGTASHTRATWNNIDKPNPGNVYENTIEKLQVLLYSADGTSFLGKLQNVSYVRRSGTDNNIYDVVGSVEVSKAYINNYKLECKIVILANYDTPVTSTGKLSDIKKNYFTYKADGMQYGTSYIPMFGVKTFGGTSGTEALDMFPDVQCDAETIYMLRAMAKVRLHSDTEGVELTSATINGHKTRGYTLPQAYTKDNTLNIDYDIETFFPYVNCKAADGQAFFGTEEETETVNGVTTTKEYLYVYVPETPKDNDVEVTVNYNGVSDTKTFKLGTYTGGKFTETSDIVRNHIYTYNLNFRDEELNIEPEVMPWNLVRSSIGWNVTAEIESSDTEGDLGVLCYPRYAKNKVVHDCVQDKSSNANYKFTLTAPEGAVWKAHLTNENDFTFVYSSPAVSTGIARTDGYTITIAAKNPWYTFKKEDGKEYKDNYKFSYSDIDANTAKGNKWEELYGVNGGPYTDLYITVSLDGQNEYRVVINPATTNKKNKYKDNRKYPGGDDYIRIWQLKAIEDDAATTEKENGFDVMSEANPANQFYK